MTALAATVGIGNIVGVATAISLGGPGAVFWMWLTGLLGMATKYSEALLAVKYREKGPLGMQGGPMYYISKGAKLPWLVLYLHFVHLLLPLALEIWCKLTLQHQFLNMFLIYL